MELIRQDGPYCLVASAAMCLGVTIDEIHTAIETDGTEIWFPPTGMRGIHIQEIQDFAMDKDKCFFPVELYPMIAPNEDTEPKTIYNTNVAKVRFLDSIRARVGVLIMSGHACAWDGETVYDPKGFMSSIVNYDVREAWLLADLI